MFTDITTLKSAYNTYSNISSPGSSLHDAFDANKLWTKAQGKSQANASFLAANQKSNFVASKASQMGLRFAAATSYILKAPDLIFGTGANTANKIAPIMTSSIGEHIKACVSHPCETGLAGLDVAVHSAILCGIGAAIGYVGSFVVGSVYVASARDPNMTYGEQLHTLSKGFATDGAVAIGGLLSLSAGLIGSLLVTGTVRMVTGAVKATVGVGAFAIGSTLGVAVGLTQLVASALTSPTAPAPTPTLNPPEGYLIDLMA